jgi:hypothetical protein
MLKTTYEGKELIHRRLWDIVEAEAKLATEKEQGWADPTLVAMVFAFHTVEAYLNYVGETLAPEVAGRAELLSKGTLSRLGWKTSKGYGVSRLALARVNFTAAKNYSGTKTTARFDCSWEVRKARRRSCPCPWYNVAVSLINASFDDHPKGRADASPGRHRAVPRSDSHARGREDEGLGDRGRMVRPKSPTGGIHV